MFRSWTTISAVLFAWFPATGLPAAEPLPDVHKLLLAAKPGETVALPAGLFRTSIVLPEGVGLRGAGYDKTTLDAGSAHVAVTVKKGGGSRLEDLAVRTQGDTAVLVQDAADVTLSRVAIHGGAVGVQLERVQNVRIENAIVEGSMTGILLSKAARSSVVNCTLVRNTSIGLSVRDADEVAVFNNLVADAGTAIVVGGDRKGLAVDHNLYVALYVGKLLGQPNRLMLGPWRDVSGGLDAASVQVPVEFADAARGDYRPVSRLDWSPGRATVSGWGVAELAGVKAPAHDIDGCQRSGAPDMGAYEVPPLEGVKSDAAFTIADDRGTKSVGLFTRDGRLVRYLFHDLPLKKGEYGCTLPTRSQLGEAVLPGDYELRLVESNLRWKYRGITANNGLPGSAATTDQHHTQYAAFAADGALLLGAGWNERGENLRCLDAATRKPRWVFRGQSPLSGLCTGGDGSIYLMRSDWGKGPFSLVKLDPAKGEPIAWPDGASLAVFDRKDVKLDGIAELAGRLYASDPAGNRVYHAPADHPGLDASFEVKSPSRPAADRRRNLLWLVSNHEKVVALEPEGKRVRAEFTGVARPAAVAVCGNRLAVASLATGKIHLFDCSDPANLKPIKTLGRGDGPYGPILPDRFYFQEHPLNSVPYSVVLDLAEDGTLVLRDYFSRTIVLNPEGKPIYESFAQFGNWPARAYFQGDDAARFFDSGGDVSWRIDAKAGTWRPDARWGWPRGKRSDALGFFSDSGKLFGVFHHTNDEGRSGVLFVRYENYAGRAVAFYTQEEVEFPLGTGKKRGMWVVRRDTNGDGRIDSHDGPGTPVLDTDGKPIAWHMPARFLFMLPDGSLVSPGGSAQPSTLGYVWRRKGIDTGGVPRYEFGPDSPIPVQQRTVPSAYDFSKTVDLGSQSETAVAPNGDYLATFQFGNSPNGMGLSNSGAIDLARFDPAGRMKWLHPLNDFGPIQGVKVSEKFILTSWGHQAEWIGLDPNGLGLGHLGYPVEAGWDGYWVDHPTQYFMFTGNDGHLQVIVGDYMLNCQHWLSLENCDNYRSAVFPVQITPAKARELSFRPAAAVRLRPKPAQPRITVRRLPGPMPIDGKLAKWRGIAPQIVITPVTSTSVSSPKDASAVIRLAYHGQDLYVQILRFDDVVSFHQPSNKSHLQDTMEMSLNGFFEGFQYSVSRFTDTGPAIIRRRFFFGKLERRLTAEHAPRVVEVLPNAKDVSERQLIESIYGEDMSQCKVIVTEFKLPIDKTTYEAAEESIFPVRSGSGFWIGFMVDDNDVPGSDTQKMLVWPATYNTFGVKEDGAYAVFE